jgi:FAD/FMN-containing dehydrogenase
MSTTVYTLEGEKRDLNSASLSGLAEQLDGELITSAHPGYEKARVVWNAMIDRRPPLIVRCLTADDVARAVRFAASENLPVAVKSGGHNIAGNAVVNEGMVVDCSAMRRIVVDPEERTARVEPGCLLGELDEATQEYGLAVPAGIVSTTGVAGLTLGGGFGWLSRKFGYTVDSLRSVDVVTAEGNALSASESEHPDLFWGLRGGGGNFGVATSFTFDLRDVGPEVFAGLVVHPLSAGSDFLKFYQDFTASAPDDLAVFVVVRHAPPLPFLPADVHGEKILAALFVYQGDQTGGEKVVAPLRAFGHPLGEHVGMVPFIEWQRQFDSLNGPGAHNYWKSHNVTAISDGLIDTIIKYAEAFPSPHCEILTAHLGGEINRRPADQTAYAHRQDPYVMNIHTRWLDLNDTDRCVTWAKELFEAAKPYSSGGVYVNFLSNEGKERVRDAYPKAVYERLVQLKNKYDPNNVFRFNQNIAPSG